MRGRRLGTSVLTAVVDRTGKGDADRVRRAFETVEGRYAAEGLRVAWPVSVEIVPLEIMGATKSARGRHTLFVSLWSLRSDMLDGLVAHEMGHMLRTEARHPSHDPQAFEALGRRVRIPRAGEPVLAEAFNHVQDIYADDLAFLTGLEDRAYRFFAGWIDRHTPAKGSNPWTDVGASMTNGFALGNLVRHGLLRAQDALWDKARAFDARAGLQAVDRFASFFAGLPTDPDLPSFAGRIEELASMLVAASWSRPS